MPKHRAIYAAIEHAAQTAGMTAAPTMCRSECGGGVTVVLPSGAVRKVSEASAANTVLTADAAF